MSEFLPVSLASSASRDAAQVGRLGSRQPAAVWIVREPRVRYTLGLVLLAAFYYASARLGYEFEFAGPVAAIVWLPVGVAIAFLYLGGLRFWPGVLAGDLLANNYSALPLGTALAQTCGNIAEVLVAAYLIRRLVPHGSPLGSVRGVGSLLAAISVGTAISATVGVLSLLLGDTVEAGELPKVWRTWWLGDASGALVVVPLALAWYRPLRTPFGRRRLLEWVFMLAATVAVSELALRSHRPLSYLVFPVLIWAALRLGTRGATLALAIIVGLTVWNTTHYVGPFVFMSITRSVLITQLFIAVAALSTLCLAAVVSERERIAERLSASRSRLVEAENHERRRLEHNLHDGAQQRLTALATQLGDARERVQRAPEQADGLFEAAAAQLQLAIDELRELAHGIHPAVLTTFGLATAIHGIAARSPVSIVVELPADRLDDASEATIYYVIAEAVTNAQRYARASEIRVRVATTRSAVHVEVVDDGVGGAVEAPDSGLEGLRDRVEAAGGTFELTSVAGRGTRVAATIPLPKSQ